MIQGYDPRTGEPAGDPVQETRGARVDTIAEAAAAACLPWERAGSRGRAPALTAVVDALDAPARDLVAVADTETTLGEARLAGEVARTTGQLRLFRGWLVPVAYQDFPPALLPAALLEGGGAT